MLFQSLRNVHFTYQKAFVKNDDENMALRSVSVSRLFLCRGRGISPGWRLPALQILWEVEGKIKPSSRCQGGFRQKHMEMIYDVVIGSHFNKLPFLIGKLILYHPAPTPTLPWSKMVHHEMMPWRQCCMGILLIHQRGWIKQTLENTVEESYYCILSLYQSKIVFFR